LLRGVKKQGEITTKKGKKSASLFRKSATKEAIRQLTNGFSKKTVIKLRRMVSPTCHLTCAVSGAPEPMDGPCPDKRQRSLQ
jgi:hypothetical protein